MCNFEIVKISWCDICASDFIWTRDALRWCLRGRCNGFRSIAFMGAWQSCLTVCLFAARWHLGFYRINSSGDEPPLAAECVGTVGLGCTRLVELVSEY